MASPARSLPPTSPLASEADFFTFDRSPPVGGHHPPVLSSQLSCPAAPQTSGSPQQVAGVSSPLSGMLNGGGPPPYFTHPSAASPRTRIKTIAGGSSGSRTAGSSRESSVETLRPCSTGSPAQTLRAPPTLGQIPTLFSISDYQVP